MRIAYVIPVYPPAPSQPFVVNEMVEVEEAGHEVVIVPLRVGAPSPVRHGTFARLHPVEVLPAPLLAPRVLLLALATLLTRPLRVLRTLVALHRAAGRNPWAHVRLAAVTPKALAAAWRARRSGVDRIHAHFASQTADCAGVAGAVSGIPFSFTAHAYDIYSTLPEVRNETLGWKLRNAAQAFAVNEFATALLRRDLPAAACARVHTAYVGIPMHLFQVAPPPPSDGTLRLLCVARFQEKKGIDTLLDALALLRADGVPVRLRLFGDGPLGAAVAAQVERLALADTVLLGGVIPQEEVAREMRACDLFVLPCRRDRTGDMDGIPTVFMEAMATGRPVVSCPVSGVPELVRDGETGLLVPSDDPQALADAIARLARDPELRARLARAGRALVERQHDERVNARRLLEIMNAPVDESQQRPRLRPSAVIDVPPGRC
jgi:glycosyltransferase involved in cell wall biosynthesis